jgi:hypothetical protein
MARRRGKMSRVAFTFFMAAPMNRLLRTMAILIASENKIAVGRLKTST